MPTKNPRLQITLSPQQYELLTRLSRAQRRPRTAVLMELLETVTPVLERVVVAIEAAERTQVMAREGLRRSIDQAEQALLPHVQAAMGQFDMFVDRVVEGAASSAGGGVGARDAGGARAPRRRSPPGRKGRQDPRPVTRGSGTGVATPPKRGQPADLAGAIARRIEEGPVKRTERRSGRRSKGGRR